MKTLIMTVGGSHAPLLTAIETLKPDRVIFLCSDDQGRTKGSYFQVEGPGKVLCSKAPKSEPLTPDLPNLVTLANLSPDRYQVIRIPQFDNLQDCYQKAAVVIHQEKTAHPDAQVFADYTGGTKSMTACLAIAALEDEKCELSLVTGTRNNLAQVQDGTQFAHAVAVWDLRALRRFQHIREALKRFDYPAAQQVLEAIAMTPISEGLLNRVRAAIAACRAFDAWDRFDHVNARHLLEPYSAQFVPYLIVLKELCSDQPVDPYLQVEDLLFNAERRAAQERFDDAVARIYRALEMLAQVRLRTKYGIDTGDVDIARLPEPSRGEFEKKRRDDGRLVTALFDSWTLLTLLADQPLGLWFAGKKQSLRSFLGQRNSSILAHGTCPLSQAVYESEGQQGLSMCRETLQRSRQADRMQGRSFQLPQALPWLDEDQKA